ncbi:hypothetical protein, partial [Mesorhizobium sp. M8A.F.Ca.ET.181.01.1.1]|uniref:hypothetical protein n=1 Tax=Mesorhizobium sp. M8A.F.Ca.ET.181.01.1.1 TaxID=2563963 RepID=UPI001AEE8A46
SNLARTVVHRDVIRRQTEQKAVQSPLNPFIRLLRRTLCAGSRVARSRTRRKQAIASPTGCARRAITLPMSAARSSPLAQP